MQALGLPVCPPLPESLAGPLLCPVITAAGSASGRRDGSPTSSPGQLHQLTCAWGGGGARACCLESPQRRGRPGGAGWTGQAEGVRKGGVSYRPRSLPGNLGLQGEGQGQRGGRCWSSLQSSCRLGTSWLLSIALPVLWNI